MLFTPYDWSVIGRVCGQAIIDHPEVRKIGFTGSTPVGKQIMASCANSNLKKCSLELGGKSPLIIFADCDLGKAVRMVSMIVLVCRVGFICCGYRCVANRSHFEIFKVDISGPVLFVGLFYLWACFICGPVLFVGLF